MNYPTINPKPLVGIGLRTQHYQDLLTTLPNSIGWLEIHSENYFAEGGKAHAYLAALREHYPVSLHGVGLYIGSTDPLDPRLLHSLKNLIERTEPMLVSEHLCWGAVNGKVLNDLLPLPYTEEALQHFCAKTTQVQDYLGRQILIENPSSYLQFAHSTIPEQEFLVAVAERTGCGILLDINNIYVSANNHNFDPSAYLAAIPVNIVQEIHLAGFENNGGCLIDTHSQPVCDEVWKLYQQALQRFDQVPTLIEWDADIPSLNVLLGEATRAQHLMESHHDLLA
ncbi:DUF692 domain-containing protein [Moraxellaceae bacterium AER2_44_116]|nr:DUF692 domain-containing protein [Moraxellaceae bacterium]TQC99330.1 DUF692 domain-containing protein [Moraxellaceae bacterium AER2_44_116]